MPSDVRELNELVQRLLKQSSRALSLTGKVIEGHRDFSRAFYRALNSSTDTSLLVLDRRMERAMETVKKRAGQVSQTVARMKEDLQEMADLLDRAVASSSKKQSRIERAKNWVRKACGVLVALLGLGAALANILLQPHVGAALGAGSVLCRKLEKALGKVSDGMWCTEDSPTLSFPRKPSVACY